MEYAWKNLAIWIPSAIPTVPDASSATIRMENREIIPDNPAMAALKGKVFSGHQKLLGA